MPIEITVPRLGWTMEEGAFVGWLKRDGDHVRAGEPLFTLDGDKALQEIEATDSGVLRIPADAPKPGSTVKVGAVLGYLITEGEPTHTTRTDVTPVQTNVLTGQTQTGPPVQAAASPENLPGDALGKQAAPPVCDPAKTISPR